jgi:hypothetical protein
MSTASAAARCVFHQSNLARLVIIAAVGNHHRSSQESEDPDSVAENRTRVDSGGAQRRSPPEPAGRQGEQSGTTEAQFTIAELIASGR